MAIFASKFVQTLKTFSEEDLKSFDQWLRSPWFNTNKNVPKLFEKLKKHYPAFDNPKLTKEKLFKQVLPNGKFSDRRMNNLLSEGYLAAERFLIFLNFSKNENLQRDLLTQELQNRHLEDWFFRDVQIEIDRLEAKPVKDWEDHLDLLRLHRRVYHHPNQKPRVQTGKQIINQMSEQLELVYLLEKAAIINEKISRNRLFKNDNHDIESELKIWLTASEGVEHTAIEFYKMRFAYQEETMLEQYFELRAIFLKRYEELNEKEQKVHLISLINDTSIFVRKGVIEMSESLPIYKIGLNKGIFLTSGILAHKIYVTIVASSNSISSFNYTEQFIKYYTKNLSPEFQLDGINWAKAHTEYWKGDLNESLNILTKHNFRVYHFQLLGRILTTQVYFDYYLNDDSYQSLLFNYFDSFEKWIQREKFHAKFNKISFLRFVQKCRALAKHYLNANFYPEKVINLLENEKNIQAFKWLESKKDEIIKKRSRGYLKSR